MTKKENLPDTGEQLEPPVDSMTYTTVLIAMNYVDNVSYVQVFRQLGLIFGMAGGIFILKERFTFPKLIGVVLILSGLALTVLKY